MTDAERDRNLVSLKEYIESRFNASDKAMSLFGKMIDARMEASDKAFTLFQEALDVRLESMNEFREENRRLTGTLVTRQECTISHARSAEDIRILREAKALSEGKASQLSVNIAFLLAVIGVVIGVMGLVF